MIIEDQVVSLELAKKLKSLNVKQESYFYWCIGEDDSNGGLPTYYTIEDTKRLNHSFYYPKDKISAFTVSELSEILPSIIQIQNEFLITSRLIIEKLYDKWWIYYDDINDIADSSQVNAIAKMLIYLIENKLIEV